jgi:phosphate uptake regulator
MNSEQQISALRIQLFKMAKLSQRATDYAIKAYESARPEFSRLVLDARVELSSLEGSIAVQGQGLLAAKLPSASDLCFVKSAMRIGRALRVTYAAATEIAQSVMLASRSRTALPSPELQDIGLFTNSQVRLYTVALFNREIHHAKQVLNNNTAAQRRGAALYRPLKDLAARATTLTPFELSTIRSLGQIVEQAHEISEAIIVWLECRDCFGVVRNLPWMDWRQIYSQPLSA